MGGTTFLQDDRTPTQLLPAVVRNHRQWLLYSARLKGGEVQREKGATWVSTPDPEGYWSILFPRMRSATAGDQIDRIVQYYHGLPSPRPVLCWSQDPPRPRDLGVRLQARGFEATDWLNWMWLDLGNMRADRPAPPGLRVDLIEDEPIWEIEDLPHYSRAEAEFRRAASRAQPRCVWHFGAWLEGRPVGHSTLFVTRGRQGVAGIWACGVIPDARKQGIGTAVTTAACRLARTLGCRYAILNATSMGEPVYPRGCPAWSHFQRFGASRGGARARVILKSKPAAVRGTAHCSICRWLPGGASRGAAVAALLLLTAMPAFAQEGVTYKRNVPAVRITTPPVIDGDLSDPCWQQASKLDRFTDELYSNPVKDQTIAYLGYDDKNIYIAFHAFDSQPSGIIARETKRGTRPNGDDWVAFTIDPFHTHKFDDRSFFIVNPLGTQYAHLAEGRGTKLEWEGKWQAAAKTIADGWVVEMAIPWEILNYPAVKGPVTCGINADRFQQRTQIHSLWSNFGVPERDELDGHWVGVQFPPYHPRLSLLPYVSPGWRDKGGVSLRAGLDARYTPTPTLTLVGTVNPDFQNVEEAVESIDFSYGERFVPDYRPFFQEGAAVYNVGGVPGQYFYSRRIGEFDVGENLYGKIDRRDTIGVLSALNPGHEEDWLLQARHELGPTANVNVGLVNRDGAGRSNRVLELGENFRKGFWNVDSSGVSSWVGTRRTGSAGNLTFSYNSSRWYADLVPHFVSPHFQDDLGFIPFTDYKGLLSDVSYSNQWRKGPVRSFSVGGYTNDSSHYDGRLFRRVRGGNVGLTSRSDYSLSFGWDGGRYEQFNDSVYSLRLGARASDPFHNYGVGYSWGRRAAHPYTFITPYATWRFGQKLTLGIASSLLFHTQNEQQHIVTFNYDFSPAQGIGGRLVAQTGGTNGYFSYRHSGYGGTEMFFIVGDPNATKFQKRVAFKVVWAL